MKTIRIKLNEHNYFEHVLNILKSVPPFDDLREREIEVYAQLLFHYDRLNKDELINKSEVNKELFGYETRKLIETKLSMSDAALRNNLSMLRSLGVINEKSLKTQFIIPFGEDIEFKFIKS